MPPVRLSVSRFRGRASTSRLTGVGEVVVGGENGLLSGIVRMTPGRPLKLRLERSSRLALTVAWVVLFRSRL